MHAEAHVNPMAPTDVRLHLSEDVEPVRVGNRSSCRLAAPSIGITDEPCGISTPPSSVSRLVATR